MKRGNSRTNTHTLKKKKKIRLIGTQYCGCNTAEGSEMVVVGALPYTIKAASHGCGRVDNINTESWSRGFDRYNNINN